MSSQDTLPTITPIPEERALLRRARGGEADAFLQLFDAYSDDLFRYVYFRVMSDVAAEAVTASVFRQAWDQLNHYSQTASSFVKWIYRIARKHVLAYYEFNLVSSTSQAGILSAAADYGLGRGSAEHSNLEAWANHLRLLAPDAEESGLRATAALVMERYLNYLDPRRIVTASPSFNVYTRAWLVRYLRFHAHRTKELSAGDRIRAAYTGIVQKLRVPAPVPHYAPTFARVSLAYALLIGTFLATGTANAQSALPGDPLYGWKRTSEKAWLSVSPDPLETEIVLANRRLEELIAVQDDPQLGANALNEYVSAMATLSATADEQNQPVIESMLQTHRVQLNSAGLPVAQVEAYLEAAIVIPPAGTTTAFAVSSATLPSTGTERPTASALAATPEPTEPEPTLTDMPTEAPTEVPTSTPTFTATATAAPTATATPTATETATDVPPTATDVPPTATDVPPTATEVPTEEPTEEPTEALPASTESPLEPMPTDESAETPIAIDYTVPVTPESLVTPTPEVIPTQ